MRGGFGCAFAPVNREQSRIAHISTGSFDEQSQSSSHATCPTVSMDATGVRRQSGEPYFYICATRIHT